jgi:hypothetical protein
MDGDGAAFKPRERVLEQSLNRYAVGLPLPADISSAVVRECQLEGANLCPRSGLHHRLTGQAERTAVGLIRRQVDRRKRLERDVDVLPAAAAVDNRACTDDVRARGTCGFDRLARGSAGRDDIFDDDDPLTRLDGESAPQRHHAVLPLGEHRAHPERAADFLADDNAADRRREHGLYSAIAKPVGECGAERLGFARMLKDQRALHVTGAVSARC